MGNLEQTRDNLGGIVQSFLFFNEFVFKEMFAMMVCISVEFMTKLKQEKMYVVEQVTYFLNHAFFISYYYIQDDP